MIRSMQTRLFLLMAACTMLWTATSSAQENLTGPPLKDLFELSVIHEGDEHYLSLAPDSTPGDAELNRRCTAMWPYLMYIFENRSKTASTVWKLENFLPDTSLIQARIDSSFNADTAFASIYMGALAKTPVAPLSIDSALHIAAHFFYLHSENDAPVMHICVGINKVSDLSASSAHPYHAAFCYQTIWEMEDYSPLLNKVKGPFSEEFKAHPPSEQRILEVEQLIYAGMAAQPELRQALIDTYHRNKEHLNFQLVY